MTQGLVTIADIQRLMAREYRVPLRVMRESDGLGLRSRKHSHPRQVAMALAVRLTDHSLTRIGHFFGGRDHSTVFYAVKAVEKRRRKGGRGGQKIHRTLRSVTLELVRR